jgi:undecaprenyl-diphosphatase
MRSASDIIAKVPGSPRLWLMLFVACVLAYSFFEIVDDVFSDPLEGDLESHRFDAAVMDFFTQFRSERLTQVAIDLTALGSVSVLAVFAILAYTVIIGTRDRMGLLHMSTALLGALLWPLLLKPWFGRDRPDLIDALVNVSDLSFPSGHAFGAAAAYATFAFFCARFVQSHAAEMFCYFFAFVLVLVVGLTRIYLGVHYPTDVIAGLTAGGAWAFFVAAGFSLLYKK